MLVKKNYGSPTFVQLVGKTIGSSQWVEVPDGLAKRLRQASPLYSFKPSEEPKKAEPLPKKEDLKKATELKVDDEEAKEESGRKSLLKSTLGKDKEKK